MRRVILESPWAGDIRKHRGYARKALKHSLSLGEAPLASHLLYPQVLDDNDKAQRKQGIEAGLAWFCSAEAVVFYADYGFSKGMLEAMVRHCEAKLPVEIRYLFKPRRATLASARKQRRAKGKATGNDGPSPDRPSPATPDRPSPEK